MTVLERKPLWGKASRGYRVRRPYGLFALATVGVVFLVLPVVGLLVRAPWRSTWQLLRRNDVTTALRLSLEAATISTVVAMVLGVPIAWLLARTEFRARSLLRALNLGELRELIHGVHPKLLTDRGLPAAVDELAGRSPVPVKAELDLPGRLPDPVESALYFAVSEALANVAKHADASEVEVSVVRENDVLRVVVRDDGRGGADPAGGSGLRGLADRVAGVDGRLIVDSPPGGGTTLIAEVPCG